MQAVWGEKWWGRKKRKLQDDLEQKRKNEEMDRLADSNRLENMRQRRIKRKMGACKYYCWPCGRAEYDKMFPRANIAVADPEAEEAERQRKVFRFCQARVRDTVDTAHATRERAVYNASRNRHPRTLHAYVNYPSCSTPRLSIAASTASGGQSKVTAGDGGAIS